MVTKPRIAPKNRFRAFAKKLQVCNYIKNSNVNGNVITMMTETKFGCSYTQLWVSPADWQKSKQKNLTADWYVQCYFFDPAFKEKYPKGFQFRKRANKPKTLQGKQSLVKHLLETMQELLDSGFNPITELIMGEVEIDQNLNEDTPVIDALEFVFNKREDNATKKDIKSVLKYTILAIRHLHLDTLSISEVKRKHIKFCLEYLQKNAVIEKKGKKNKKTRNYDNITYHKLTDKRYNKYVDYLSMLFKDIIEYEAIENNPCNDLSKKKVIKEFTKVLTNDERETVKTSLAENKNLASFSRFLNIFFHSGGRIKELLSLKVKEVDLENQRYKVVIRKGGLDREVWKVIKTIAIPYWKEAIKGADPEAYVFHKGLIPGISEKPLYDDAISKRWKRHIKGKLGISCNVYGLKHLNLDEVTALLSMEDAAAMASHTTTRMMYDHYAIREEQRQFERLKMVANEF